ncbi:MAG: YebC/PmpR family DNA-binding transcriptional regulator [Deltaproteobacteria bacterium]|nr:YebC/PmpR family DNA-binding transcriptional regulator [Deltaproteobacteria bacterium]
MAGHSKWANIKHRKGAQDAKRGKAFSKVVKDIMVASRMGGPDPEANPRLRLAIAKAKAVSLPRENLERAIKKGAGLLEGENYEEVMYEAYGPGGVAILVECLTDNRNRTASEVRHAFSKRGFSIGASGSAAHSFNRRGEVIVSAEGTDEESVMMAAMEHGGDDVQETSDDDGKDVFQVVCEVPDLETLREGLEAEGLKVTGYGLTWIPSVSSPVAGKDAEQLLALLEAVEDVDDTRNVYANYDISDDEMARIVGG